MLRGTMTPDPNTEAALLSAQLLKLIQQANPDAVVLTTGQRIEPKRRRHFAPDEMVRVVTANDNEVCKFCRDIAAGGPYRFQDVRRSIPHHPWCRCRLAPLRVTDPGWLYQHPRPSIKQFVRVAHAHIMPKAPGRPRKRKMPQQNAKIVALLKKKRKFLAPKGRRALKIFNLHKRNKRK
jgi:hypothetical protein